MSVSCSFSLPISNFSSLGPSEREREGERRGDRERDADRQREIETERSKTLLYKDCSLGSV